MSNKIDVNLGKLTDDAMHDIDCECDAVIERIRERLPDCNASYGISRDANGNVIVSCYDGFTEYWQASNEIGY